MAGRGQHTELLGALLRGVCRASHLRLVLVHRRGCNVPGGSSQVSQVVDVGIGTVVGGQFVQHEGSNRREVVSHEDDEVVVKRRGLQGVRHVLRRGVPDVDRGVAR